MSCIAVLGGSFDPVHNGHLALATYFTDLLKPDALRIIPAGNPWQKKGLEASADDRVAMLERAFLPAERPQQTAISIDLQEIERQSPTYSIDTLRGLRAELGPQASIAFLIGADQLQKLHTWREWQALFDYCHVCAATRPGYSLATAELDVQVAAEFRQRMASAGDIRARPAGCSYLGTDLAVDISATALRAQIRSGAAPGKLLPPAVLDYIQQHHLYRS